MITGLNGSAMVINGDQKTVAEPMMYLAPKSMIELRPGANMSVVFFSRGSHERFVGPALIGIGENRSKVFKGDQSGRQEVSSDSALIKAIDPHALAEGPASGGVTVSTADGKTTIAWQSTTPGPYLVSVFKPAQKGAPRVGVWAEELAASSVDYTGPALDPAVTYVAEVKAGQTSLAASQFRIAAGQAEMLGAAKAEADQMVAANPSDTTPHVLMHTLYSQVGEHESAAIALHPAVAGQPEEDAFINRLNVMGKAVNAKANADTAYAQGIYQAQDNWEFAPYWDPNRWAWDGWDDL
jgi:hypothetical protein